MPNKIQFVTGKELMKMKFPPRDCGNWVYRSNNLILFNRKTDYEVDLERLTTSAEALDWILQISCKYPSEFDLPGFINVLKDAVDDCFCNSAQGVLCPGGRSMVLDWRRKTYKRAKPND
jgi:hypothetical protein